MKLNHNLNVGLIIYTCYVKVLYSPMHIFLLDATIESIEDRSSPNVALDQFINTPQFDWDDEEGMNNFDGDKAISMLRGLASAPTPFSIKEMSKCKRLPFNV